jgi:hypothetical protein
VQVVPVVVVVEWVVDVVLAAVLVVDLVAVVVVDWHWSELDLVAVMVDGHMSVVLKAAMRRPRAIGVSLLSQGSLDVGRVERGGGLVGSVDGRTAHHHVACQVKAQDCCEYFQHLFLLSPILS